MSGVKGKSGPPGIPKHELQRYRMSQAKLGKPLSQEHKDSLAASQQKRWDLIHSLMEVKNIPYSEAKLIYKLF